MNELKSFRTTLCLFIVVLAMLQCTNEPQCEICGKYNYESYEVQSVFSDSDIADMIGRENVEAYKKKLKSEASAIYALTLSAPEIIENGELRGTLYLAIRVRNFGDIIYNGQFLTVSDDETADGMFRIERRYNDSKEEFEQITFNNGRNVLLFTITDKGLVVEDYSSDEAELSLDGALFVKE